jgi:hypothetical protein
MKLFLGAIDLMNPQKPCPRCGRSGFGRADVTSGRQCPLSAPGTKRTCRSRPACPLLRVERTWRDNSFSQRDSGSDVVPPTAELPES